MARTHPQARGRTEAGACPCGSTRPYAGCCGRWHAGPQHLQAPDAEALMRSRYCAYVMGLGGYLLDTWHPSQRPAEPLVFEPGVQWLGLELKRHTRLADDRAEVAFVARSKFGGRAHRLVETSRFVREDGRWYYVDGDTG
jgi:SEC-C motif domain protein